MTETVAAPNPTDANASAGGQAPPATEAPATTLTSAGDGTGGQQQTQTEQTQQPPAVEKPATETQNQNQPVAPEKYTFTAPEGTEYDAELLGSFEAAARKANLSQDAAQALLAEMAPAYAARTVDQVNAIHQEWREQSAADTEFGGEKFVENLAVAKKALDLFDPLPAPGADGKQEKTPLRSLLDETGLGNHPEILRLMYRAGKAISEDKFVAGAPRGTGDANATSILFDKTKKG